MATSSFVLMLVPESELGDRGEQLTVVDIPEGTAAELAGKSVFATHSEFHRLVYSYEIMRKYLKNYLNLIGAANRSSSSQTPTSPALQDGPQFSSARAQPARNSLLQQSLTLGAWRPSGVDFAPPGLLLSWLDIVGEFGLLFGSKGYLA